MGKDVENNRFSPDRNCPTISSMDTPKRTKELPMTVLELKSTVYLVPEVAWPVIKQNEASTGNRLQCYEVTSDALG